MSARNRTNHLCGMDRTSGSGTEEFYLPLIAELGRLLDNAPPPDLLIPQLLNICYTPPISLGTVIRLTGAKDIPPGLHHKFHRMVRPRMQEVLTLESACAELALAHGKTCTSVELLHKPSLFSCISVPLRLRNCTLGSITFFENMDNSERFFTQQPIFESIAAMITSVLAGSVIEQLTHDHETQIKEFTFLYRLSNTMLSTMQLNKLIHLTLTALIAGATPFFDRAMLFLINNRSRVLQGMLGVTCETSADLANHIDDEEDLSSSRWAISDEEMVHQKGSEFNRLVMSSRIELNKVLNISSKAVLEKRLIFVPHAKTDKRVDRDFIDRFDISSFAVAPLMARDRVVGVIVVDNAIHGGPIDKDDLRFLQLFANQAGMAIENAILYNRVEDSDHDLREAQERLLQGEKLATIGEMTAGIAHELKAPLVAIGGFANRLARKLEVTSVEWEYADLISREVLRLEKMLADILLFSKKATLCYTPCNLNDIVRSALAVVAPTMQENGILITTKYLRRAALFQGDCEQLKQVFINILSNAYEAMNGNGGELHISLSSSELDGRKALSVAIADTGGGIPLEALHTIFTPFYTSKDTGTGLGLPIADRIITNHGGKIRVNNSPGEGVEFTVVIPLQQ